MLSLSNFPSNTLEAIILFIWLYFPYILHLTQYNPIHWSISWSIVANHPSELHLVGFHSSELSPNKDQLVGLFSQPNLPDTLRHLVSFQPWIFSLNKDQLFGLLSWLNLPDMLFHLVNFYSSGFFPIPSNPSNFSRRGTFPTHYQTLFYSGEPCQQAL